MHSPESVAFEIYLGRKQKKNGHYRSPLVTIWHNDPRTDGTDDSCGRFIRKRHANKEMLEKIEKEFKFNIEHNYWFTERGVPIFSTIGILMLMYQCAYWQHCRHSRKKLDKFMRKYTHYIIHMAENPTDCFGDSIVNKWNDKEDKFRFVRMAGSIYTDILRKERPWYKHPRWHINHWAFTFPLLSMFWTKYFRECDMCHKRGFGTTYGFSDWSGGKRWCPKCNNSNDVAKSAVQ